MVGNLSCMGVARSHASERLIYSVTQLSPETEYFWVHAAGMLAMMSPHWRIGS